MSQVTSRTVRRLAALGVAVLALGPAAGAGAASASAPPPSNQAQSPQAQPPPGPAPLPTGTVVPLSGDAMVSHWAYPQVAAVVRATPSRTARAVGNLHFLTADSQAEIYVALAQERLPGSGEIWVKVSVPRRPNGVTGWVPASALGPLNVVYGRLVIDRSRLRATFYDRSGSATWSAPVGVGRPSLPTPAGDFYVLEKLRAIGGPFYGPYAIGTSAYAPSLSEWPGGGIVGIHGTDQPQLVPGRPSHGCIRLRNTDIRRLWGLVKLGTPITIK